jgi:predicted ATPase/DNA-binding CsgD family transcriptional regulator
MHVVTDVRTLADAGVSAREAEVLALLGEHLTNAEIGSRLYISVRTVESHVSSLLRKLAVADRRTLAELAPPPDGSGLALGQSPQPLPVPLTSFVGRLAERAALAAALDVHRLVTAVGPGGVGKTRLALAVATDSAPRYADGACYVDLVPVTDAAMVPAAVASALGLGEQLGRSSEETVVGRLRDSEILLVLDNCEHLIEGVARFVERLLSSCGRVVVLATSRARLVVPFEWVFAVPGLSLPNAAQEGDAVALFLQRAGAVAPTSATADDTARIAEICGALDGMALAIELAAARLATLGLDGLEAALEDRLRMLAGGARADDRHRSLRDTLDWSYALLHDADQAVLRRVSVFAAPFVPSAAAVVAARPPLTAGDVTAALGRLADHSLLVVTGTAGAIRYRVLETIRQYGFERLEHAGEASEAGARHLGWCLDTAHRLTAERAGDAGSWRTAFDAVVDDFRAALAWAADHERRADGYQLGLLLADLLFARGRPGETQRGYEQAAGLALDERDAATALRLAAGTAEGRQMGSDALRLYRQAADAFRRGGDPADAAVGLARSAEIITRAPGILAEIPPAGTVEALLAEAHVLAGDDARAHAAILTTEAFRGREVDVLNAELAERAVELARRVGDPVLESSSLDALASSQLAHGDLLGGAASTRRRVARLELVPLRAHLFLEFLDGYQMAAETSIGAGDLAAARRYAERLRDLPHLGEETHIAIARLLAVDALTGQFDQVVAGGDLFREAWDRAGRPVAGNLAIGASSVALVHALRGDDSARADWLDIVDTLRRSVWGVVGPDTGYGPAFDAMVFLQRGRPLDAMTALRLEPELLRQWQTSVWRQWYAALWVEAAVLSEAAGVEDRLARARFIATGNPVATALVDRAAALRVGDQDGLRRAAAALRTAGCRYQWARTLVLTGGDDGAAGQATLDAMGVDPTSWD